MSTIKSLIRAVNRQHSQISFIMINLRNLVKVRYIDISMLSECINEHFSSENLLMQKMKYCGTEEHTVNHAVIIQRIAAFLANCSKEFEEGSALYDKMLILVDLIDSHLVMYDQHLFRHIEETRAARLSAA